MPAPPELDTKPIALFINANVYERISYVTSLEKVKILKNYFMNIKFWRALQVINYGNTVITIFRFD